MNCMLIKVFIHFFVLAFIAAPTGKMSTALPSFSITRDEAQKRLLYQQFIFETLLPFTKKTYPLFSFKEKSFCGFSLGGLNALDIVWNHPKEFSKAGIFSGSLWWRNVSQDDPAFDERNHRIMHNQIRNEMYAPWLKFFFETGTLDETADRNNNGIIDSIDDTLSLIEELCYQRL